MKKYTASLHVNANKDNVRFIGQVSANSISELKEVARFKAKDRGFLGRVLVSCQCGREFNVNIR